MGTKKLCCDEHFCMRLIVFLIAYSWIKPIEHEYRRPIDSGNGGAKANAGVHSVAIFFRISRCL